MGLARKIEQRLEQLVDGLSSALFRGEVHSVELAARLVRQADLAVTEATAGPAIPNRWHVEVNPRELPAVDKADLERELAAALAETAAERGWRTGGPVVVQVVEDETVVPGSIRCEPASQPGQQPPWAQLVGPGGSPVLDIGDNRTLIGRSPSADIVLTQPEVSRIHAVIFRKEGGVWLMDLGSVNGTRCGGQVVDGEPVAARAGDVLEFGPATFALRLV